MNNQLYKKEKCPLCGKYSTEWNIDERNIRCCDNCYNLYREQKFNEKREKDRVELEEMARQEREEDLIDDEYLFQ